MKKLSFVLFLMLSTNFFAQADITGKWDTKNENNSKVTITEKNGVCTGVVVATDNKDIPIGRIILKDLKYDDGAWHGEVYSSAREKWYDAEVTKKGNTLEVVVSVLFITKTFEWVKMGNN